jgi:S1-C subfamily serine protease
MKPDDVVLPLLAIDSNGNVDDFLGSGFFVGEGSLFVTAMHNTEAVPEKLGVVHIDDLEHTFPASVLLTDRDSDIAILNIPDYRPKAHLTIETKNNLPANLPVICYEYGTTVKQGREILLAPAVRMGNVTRILSDLNVLGRSLIDPLELSFPALRGASGAPVLSSNGFRVLGMIVANVSYHLIPSQIETTISDDGQIIEETRFMLPLGIAVHYKSIRKAISAAEEKIRLTSKVA